MRTTPVVRVVAVGAAMAVLAACGTGSESSSDSTSGSSGSGGPATISWWHNSNTDPGKAYYDAGRQGLRGLAPRRHDPGQRDAARGHGHQARRGLPERRRARRLHGARRRRARRPRRGGPDQGHLRVGQGRHRAPSAARSPAGRSTARPTPCRSRSAWSASGTTRRSSRRPASRRPPATMDEFYAAVDKLKAAGIAPVSVGAGDKWPAAHYWYYIALRECPKQVLQDAVKSLDFSDPCFVKAGEDVREDRRGQAVQQGLPLHPRPDRADERLRPARHRQGRDGDAGPLGARRHAGPDRRREGPRRRTPAGSRSRPSTAARVTRARPSVAATPGPWPRTPRTPRSTS